MGCCSSAASEPPVAAAKPGGVSAIYQADDPDSELGVALGGLEGEELTAALHERLPPAGAAGASLLDLSARRLTLSNVSAAEELGRLISTSMPRLQKLDMSRNELGSAFGPFLAPLAECKLLRVVDISHNPLGAAVGVACEGMARRAKAGRGGDDAILSLEEVRLQYTSAGDGSVPGIVALLERCPDITALDLSGIGISGGGATRIAAALRKAGAAGESMSAEGPEQLRILNLADNALDAGSFGAVAQVLRSSCARLTELRLGRNFARSEGVTALASQLRLRSWERLAVLDLENVDAGDAGAKALAAALQYTPGLAELRLASNGIGNDGAFAIARAMQERAMRCLRILDVRGNPGIGPAAANALVVAAPASCAVLRG